MDQDYTVEAAVTDQANREITGRGRFLATRGTFRIHVEPVSYADPRGRVGAAERNRGGLRQPPGADPRSTCSWSPTNMPTARPDHSRACYRRDHRRQRAGPGYSAGQIKLAARKWRPRPPRRNSVWCSTPAICGSWVATKKAWGGESRAVQMIADKKTYAPGETAHLSILSQCRQVPRAGDRDRVHRRVPKGAVFSGQVAYLRSTHHGGCTA